MSYLVLARKYRPQTFSEVIGQEHVTRTLQNAITRGRIHHAFLFCGGRGTGKTTTARILAKALSCVNAPTPEPCNVCEACVEITRGTSVDVQEIDAASQNKVEDVRELRESIRYAPVRGKKKLFILDEVHMLSTSAFNALLKTLEEPPPHAVFVFATTDPHKLPQTILSRVQRYDFKLVPTARLVDHLADVLHRESVEFERSALTLIAREGAGSVRDSLSLADQVLASCHGKLTEEQAAAILGVADRSLILSLGRAVVSRDPEQVLKVLDAAYGKGYDLSQLARNFLGHLRDLVVVSVVKDPEPLLEVTGPELEELRRQTRQAGGAAELLFDRMVRVAEETSRAALPRYVLEVGMVELCRVEPLQPFSELVGRLESLEGRLGPGGGNTRGEGGGGPSRSMVQPPPEPPSLSAPISAGPPPIHNGPAPSRNGQGKSHSPSQKGHGLDGTRDFTALAAVVLERAPLLHCIAIGRAISWDDERLVIGFDSQYAADQVREKLTQLNRLLSEDLGQPYRVEVQVALSDQKGVRTRADETLVESEARKATEDRSQRRREAIEHPARKLVTEVFGEDVSFQEPELE